MLLRTLRRQVWDPQGDERAEEGTTHTLQPCKALSQSARRLISARCAGRFGFQREMNALSTLKSGEDTEDGTNVTALLHSTHEIERRLQEVNRWFRLWKRDVREAWVTLGRFKASPELIPNPHIPDERLGEAGAL